MELGRQTQAIDCYNKALEIDPKDSTAWNNKGAALMELGRQTQAIDCYNKALEIDPKDSTAWINKQLALDLPMYNPVIYLRTLVNKFRCRVAMIRRNKS